MILLPKKSGMNDVPVRRKRKASEDSLWNIYLLKKRRNNEAEGKEDDDDDEAKLQKKKGAHFFLCVLFLPTMFNVDTRSLSHESILSKCVAVSSSISSRRYWCDYVEEHRNFNASGVAVPLASHSSEQIVFCWSSSATTIRRRTNTLESIRQTNDIDVARDD